MTETAENSRWWGRIADIFTLAPALRELKRPVPDAPSSVLTGAWPEILADAAAGISEPQPPIPIADLPLIQALIVEDPALLVSSFHPLVKYLDQEMDKLHQEIRNHAMPELMEGMHERALEKIQNGIGRHWRVIRKMYQLQGIGNFLLEHYYNELPAATPIQQSALFLAWHWCEHFNAATHQQVKNLSQQMDEKIREWISQPANAAWWDGNGEGFPYRGYIEKVRTKGDAKEEKNHPQAAHPPQQRSLESLATELNKQLQSQPKIIDQIPLGERLAPGLALLLYRQHQLLPDSVRSAEDLWQHQCRHGQLHAPELWAIRMQHYMQVVGAEGVYRQQRGQLIKEITKPEPLNERELSLLMTEMAHLMGEPFTGIIENMVRDGRIASKALPLARSRAHVSTHYSGEKPAMQKPWLFAPVEEGGGGEIRVFWHELLHYCAHEIAGEASIPVPINETYALLGELCLLQLLRRIRPEDAAMQSHILSERVMHAVDAVFSIQCCQLELGLREAIAAEDIVSPEASLAFFQRHAHRADILVANSGQDIQEAIQKHPAGWIALHPDLFKSTSLYTLNYAVARLATLALFAGPELTDAQWRELAGTIAQTAKQGAKADIRQLVQVMDAIAPFPATPEALKQLMDASMQRLKEHVHLQGQQPALPDHGLLATLDTADVGQTAGPDSAARG